jgi:hypothetical protein
MWFTELSWFDWQRMMPQLRLARPERRGPFANAFCAGFDRQRRAKSLTVQQLPMALL